MHGCGSICPTETEGKEGRIITGEEQEDGEDRRKMQEVAEKMQEVAACGEERKNKLRPGSIGSRLIIGRRISEAYQQNENSGCSSLLSPERRTYAREGEAAGDQPPRQQIGGTGEADGVAGMKLDRSEIGSKMEERERRY